MRVSASERPGSLVRPRGGRTSDETTRRVLRAIRVAPAAIAALRVGSHWKVFSSHSHAVNLVDSSGKLISLTDDRLRIGPFSIEVDTFPSDPLLAEATVPVSSRGKASVLLGRLALDLTAVQVWEPKPDWPALAALSWRSDLLPVIVARLRASAPRGSLAGVVQSGLDGADGLRAGGRPTEGLTLQDLPQAKAGAAAVRLARALRRGDLREMESAAASLAGTGPGLTPSGDDFLIGVMFGARSACNAPQARALADFLARAAAGRTNRISQAWLSAAADGEAIQGWHELVASILSRDAARVGQACQDLIELGHTSGADALTGFVAFHQAQKRPPLDKQGLVGKLMRSRSA